MSLRNHFESLGDEERVSRIEAGGLTEEEASVAVEEAKLRGLRFNRPTPDIRETEDGRFQGDRVILERGLSPQEAQILAGFLRSAGIAAEMGDVNIVQTHALLSIAVGGACIRVPQSQRLEAVDLLAALRRGDFALADDFDPTGPLA